MTIIYEQSFECFLNAISTEKLKWALTVFLLVYCTPTLYYSCWLQTKSLIFVKVHDTLTKIVWTIFTLFLDKDGEKHAWAGKHD